MRIQTVRDRVFKSRRMKAGDTVDVPFKQGRLLLKLSRAGWTEAPPEGLGSQPEPEQQSEPEQKAPARGGRRKKDIEPVTETLPEGGEAGDQGQDTVTGAASVDTVESVEGQTDVAKTAAEGDGAEQSAAEQTEAADAASEQK